MPSPDIWAWHRQQSIYHRERIRNLNQARALRQARAALAAEPREEAIQRRVDYMIDRLIERAESASGTDCVDLATKMGRSGGEP